MQNLDRYFVAIVPSQDINYLIIELKQFFSINYNTKAALRSPPHITLVPPFQYKRSGIEEIINTLKESVVNLECFPIHLKGFGSFPPKVIFVRVMPNDTLLKTQKVISYHLKRNLNIEHKNTNNRIFQPHITVAFRDLRKVQFYRAWEEFKQKSFDASFTCKSISLLRHNGKIWEVYREVSFLS